MSHCFMLFNFFFRYKYNFVTANFLLDVKRGISNVKLKQNYLEPNKKSMELMICLFDRLVCWMGSNFRLKSLIFFISKEISYEHFDKSYHFWCWEFEFFRMVKKIFLFFVALTTRNDKSNRSAINASLQI